MTDGLSCLRCPGCGAPAHAGAEKCPYCGRVYDWDSILRRLPEEYMVLRKDGIPVGIVWEPPRIPTKTTR